MPQICINRDVAILIFLCVIFLSILIYVLKKGFCFRHFHLKTLKPYAPYDGERFCEQCLQEEMNPSVTCSCGWKGKYLELVEYSYNDDTCSVFHCPDCEKEVQF